VIPCAKLSNLDERWGILSIGLRECVERRRGGGVCNQVKRQNKVSRFLP
jgi:hypothetical protein